MSNGLVFIVPSAIVWGSIYLVACLMMFIVTIFCRFVNGFFDPRHKRSTMDSGYSTSENGDQRWSQESQEVCGLAEIVPCKWHWLLID